MSGLALAVRRAPRAVGAMARLRSSQMWATKRGTGACIGIARLEPAGKTAVIGATQTVFDLLNSQSSSSVHSQGRARRAKRPGHDGENRAM